MDLMKILIIACMTYSLLNHLMDYKEGLKKTNSLFNIMLHAVIITYIFFK